MDFLDKPSVAGIVAVLQLGAFPFFYAESWAGRVPGGGDAQRYPAGHPASVFSA
jgi:hypothetical protein